MSENKVMKNTMLSFIKMSEKNKGKNQHILNLKVHKKISSIFPVNNFLRTKKQTLLKNDWAYQMSLWSFARWLSRAFQLVERFSHMYPLKSKILTIYMYVLVIKYCANNILPIMFITVHTVIHDKKNLVPFQILVTIEL